jgi:hypothetical protein
MSEDDLTPTQWFDQFPPAAVDRPWPEESQWCARHWAPCPILGANGIVATMELMRIWLEEMSDLAPDQPTEDLNAALATAGRLCCTLGDERMYDLWGKCPPPPSTTEEPT